VAVLGDASNYWCQVLVGSGVPVTVKSVALLVASKVEAANPSQPNVQITHSNAAPNDLSGAVDPEPAFQKIGWRAEHTLEDMIDEAIQRIAVEDTATDRW